MLCHARVTSLYHYDKNRQNATNGTTKQQKNPPPSPGPIRKLGKRTNLYCRHHKDEFVCDFLYWEYKTFGPGRMLLQICKLFRASRVHFQHTEARCHIISTKEFHKYKKYCYFIGHSNIFNVSKSLIFHRF